MVVYVGLLLLGIGVAFSQITISLAFAHRRVYMGGLHWIGDADQIFM